MNEDSDVGRQLFGDHEPKDSSPRESRDYGLGGVWRTKGPPALLSRVLIRTRHAPRPYWRPFSPKPLPCPTDRSDEPRSNRLIKTVHRSMQTLTWS